MATVTSFHKEKCRRLVSKHKASVRGHLCTSVLPVPDLFYGTFVFVLVLEKTFSNLKKLFSSENLLPLLYWQLLSRALPYWLDAKRPCLLPSSRPCGPRSSRTTWENSVGFGTLSLHRHHQFVIRPTTRSVCWDRLSPSRHYRQWTYIALHGDVSRVAPSGRMPYGHTDKW